jgi:hypothetical protein
MKIIRDRDLEGRLYTTIQDNWNNNERMGIHLSDLLVPRRAYYQKLFPKPATPDEILYWLSGSAIETGLGRALGVSHGATAEYEGVFYSPDFFLEHLTELKSRRRYLAEEGKEEAEYEHYLNQLKGYLAFTKKNVGNLVIISLAEKVDNWKTKPVLAGYRVEYTDEELDGIRYELLAVKEKLQIALENKDPKDLPLCPRWMCYKKIKNQVETPKCITCDREFKTDWGLGKHGEANTTHKLQPTKYDEVITPTCKWFAECGCLTNKEK